MGWKALLSKAKIAGTRMDTLLFSRLSKQSSAYVLYSLSVAINKWKQV